MSWLFEGLVVIIKEITPWLFKDPINRGQMNEKILIFFLEKQLIKFSFAYWPLSFCKILKKFLQQIQSYEDVIFGTQMVHLPQTNFFLKKIINVIFIYLLAPFILQKFKKKIIFTEC